MIHKIKKYILAYPLTVSAILLLLFIAGVLSITLSYQKKESMVPADTLALFGLSKRHYEEGNYDEAIAINKRFAEQQIDFWNAELTTGNAFFKKGDFKKAQKHFLNAIELNKNVPMPYLNLALTYFRLGDIQNARKTYQHIMSEFSEEYPRYAARAHEALQLLPPVSPPPNS